MIMVCTVCNAEADINYSVDEEVAVCSICQGKFKVNFYQEKMLRETKSVIKTGSGKRGFMFPCMNCSVEREVHLKGNGAVCATCGATVNLPPAMINALRVKDGGGGSEVSSRPAIQMGRSKPKNLKLDLQNPMTLKEADPEEEPTTGGSDFENLV